MEKEKVLQKINSDAIIAVIRASDEKEAINIADACVSGGIKILELTFTIPFAHKIIEKLSFRYPKDILIGSGTVLDSETARISILSGASFVVSPCFEPNMIALCNRYRIPVMPGVMTITEALRAIEAGADVLKVFPAQLFGPKIISAIRGPLPQAKLIPTGGVSAENLSQWFLEGAFAVGACGSLLEGAKSGDFKKIEDNAYNMVLALNSYRSQNLNI